MSNVEWDPQKAETNLRKHSVDFADAATVLFDERAVTVPDAQEGEDRYATLGADGSCRILVVVYTWRCGRARLISARKATRRERRAYER